MGNQQIRQSELFAGEAWQVLYTAFANVNLQAYDFDTIRQVLVEYIQRSYPEDFNDWIQNQEFTFIIDLLAYLGQSLAFRTDLNSRENFLDTAERRESILRLAKMIGYNPKRNFPARGLLKLTKVRTTEDVRDSLDASLANLDIVWNDPTNLDWYERFILVLNACFINTNPFGIPVKSGLVGSINTQLYQINSAPLRAVADTFSGTVNGQSMNFEVANPDFDPLGFFTERSPDPLNGKHLIYRTDGAGNSSVNTGFFSYFKQGTLQFSDYQFEFPQENRIIDINVDNINELDVWVEEINELGLVQTVWTKVPTVENIAFNSVNRQERNIFSVITRDNDQISIRFGDGRFGRSPVGLFRVWYRTSNGLSYQIESSDLQDIQITIPYLKNTGGSTQEYDLTLTFSLDYGISSRDVGGSLPRETDAQIKQRAPQVYYTQNRMVNGEDYNIYPLQYANSIRKVRSINRTYSGQSRYIDINDPTGRYQNTNVFGDEGILYKELFQRNEFENLPSPKSPRQIIEARIIPLVEQIDVRDFYFTVFPRVTINDNPYPTRWYKASAISGASTGQFEADITLSNTFVPQAIGPGTSNNYPYLREGALVKFQNPLDVNDIKWVKIEQVTADGVDPLIGVTGIGPVVLSEEVESEWLVIDAIPVFRQTFLETEIDAMATEIDNERTFGIRYDTEDAVWKIITANNVSFGSFSLAFAGDESDTNKDSSWLLLAEYLPGSGFWRFTSRNLRYVFESVETSRFFFIDDYKVIDSQRNLALRDYIRVMKFNSKPTPNNDPLEDDYYWSFVRPFTYADGFIEPRRVQITFRDNDADGVPDDPDIFDKIVDPAALEPGSSITERYVYQQRIVQNDYEYYVPTTNVITFALYTDINVTTLAEDEIGFAINNNTFYTNDGLIIVPITDGSYKAFVGRQLLNYQWKHYAPSDHRIDPAITNIIDVYTLTENYYQSVQNWVRSINRDAFPVPPTSDDLRTQFVDLEKSKMMTDEIIWHSAKFKLLFGDGATEDLKAQFKVIKVPGTTLTDNEIKQRVLSAINEFFAVDNWSFGENFYYTELAAYIHQQLATVVASVVIVPLVESSKFGELFVVRSEPDELFLSTAAISDIIIVENYTTNNIRIGN